MSNSDKSDIVVATLAGTPITFEQVAILSALTAEVVAQKLHRTEMTVTLRAFIDQSDDLKPWHTSNLDDRKLGIGLNQLMKEAMDNPSGELHIAMQAGKDIHASWTSKNRPSLAIRVWRIAKRILFPFSK